MLRNYLSSLRWLRLSEQVYKPAIFAIRVIFDVLFVDDVDYAVLTAQLRCFLSQQPVVSATSQLWSSRYYNELHVRPVGIDFSYDASPQILLKLTICFLNRYGWNV